MDEKPEITSSTAADILDTSSRENLANYYLKKHKIIELFHNITSELVYRHPEDPRSFIIEYIETLLTAKQAKTGHPCLFDESNVRSLFGIMDPAGNGFINHAQYKAGMENLGVEKYDKNPPGASQNHITLNTFVTVANNGLETTSASFVK